jgi:hypothetical protein
MSASSFLAELWQRGVVLRLSADRSRILVPRRLLTPDLRDRLAHDTPEFLKLLGYVDEYRALVRNAFAIMLEHDSSQKGLRELADDQARLIDELGVPLAAAIRDNEAKQWRRETGLCPVCEDARNCTLCAEQDGAGAGG